MNYFQKGWLHNALKKFGYSTIYQFGNENNIPNQYLYSWNSLKKIPSVATIIRLCYYLECTPNDLLLNHQEEY